MDIRLKDRLVMKKKHPCGCDTFTVERIGMDFKLRCDGCAHEIMLPRRQAERNIRRILRESSEENDV